MRLAILFSLLPALVTAAPSRRWNNDTYPKLPSTSNTTLHPFELATCSDSFVTARNGKLYLDGKNYTFASFNNPEIIGSSDAVLDDIFSSLTAFARPVTRTYTLGVVSVNVKNSSAFIQGWSNSTQDWIYNEAAFVNLDRAMAAARKWGCKLTIPVINQDYGSQSSNFNGNWADLIQLYYGLTGDGAYNASRAYDFWQDRALIDATKKIYSKLLSRKNTVNGVVYGHDNTFWAIETGNELNLNMTPGFFPKTSYPAPGSWTVEIAEHIKSLAPNILVMDGSLSRSKNTADKFNMTALQSDAVDLFSYHYYDVQYGQLPFFDVPEDAQYVQKHGKTFVVGEFGFFPNTTSWDRFYEIAAEYPVAGSMVWGQRPHADNGGFEVHGEGNGIYSYHVPGWSPPMSPEFDPLEQYIVASVFTNSYKLLSESVPFYPTPAQPTIVRANTTSKGTSYFQYRGGAWGYFYEIWHLENGQWTEVVNIKYDDVLPGMANYTVDASKHGNGNGSWVMRGVSTPPLLTKGPWSNVLTI